MCVYASARALREISTTDLPALLTHGTAIPLPRESVPLLHPRQDSSPRRLHCAASPQRSYSNKHTYSRPPGLLSLQGFKLKPEEDQPDTQFILPLHFYLRHRANNFSLPFPNLLFHIHTHTHTQVTGLTTCAARGLSVLAYDKLPPPPAKGCGKAAGGKRGKGEREALCKGNSPKEKMERHLSCMPAHDGDAERR